jgi:hypothetical protein
MKTANAFVVCLVLALVAGRARGYQPCRISKKAASSCSFYSDALNMQLTLTQACVSSASLSSPEYNQENQPWWGKAKSTVYSFILEVYNNCNFGQPNHGGVNTSPWACYAPKKGGPWTCVGINKNGKRTKRPAMVSLPKSTGLLLANN